MGRPATEKKTAPRKARQKRLGAYYTPGFIADFICRRAILSWIGIGDVQSVSGLLKAYGGNLQNLERRLAEITVLDMACGPGAFLLAALEVLTELHLAVYHAKNPPKPDNTRKEGQGAGPKSIRRQILEHNLFGVDIDPTAVEACRAALGSQLGEGPAKERQILLGIKRHIKLGDALFEGPTEATALPFNWAHEFPEVVGRGGFAVIVGNPPYVDIKELPPAAAAQIFAQYPLAHNRANLFAVFLERMLALLAPSGHCGFIVPNSLLYNSSYTRLRAALLLAGNFAEIIRLPDRIFAGATVETVIATYQKAPSAVTACRVLIYPPKAKITTILPEEAASHFEIDNSLWREAVPPHWAPKDKKFPTGGGQCRITLISPETRRLLHKIEADTTPLNKFCDFSLGITPYDRAKGHSAEVIQGRAFHSSSRNSKDDRPLVSGGDLVPYCAFRSERSGYIRYGDWLGAPREVRFFAQRHILVRQIVSGRPSTMIAALIEEGGLFNTQIGFNILIHEGSGLSYEYLTALLNSSVMNFYHRSRYLDSTKRLFQKVLLQNAKQFPIRQPPPAEERRVQELVRGVITASREVFALTASQLARLKSPARPIAVYKALARLKRVELASVAKCLREKGGHSLDRITEDNPNQAGLEAASEIAGALVRRRTARKEIEGIICGLYGLDDEEAAFIGHVQ